MDASAGEGEVVVVVDEAVEQVLADGFFPEAGFAVEDLSVGVIVCDFLDDFWFEFFADPEVAYDFQLFLGELFGVHEDLCELANGGLFDEWRVDFASVPPDYFGPFQEDSFEDEGNEMSPGRDIDHCLSGYFLSVFPEDLVGRTVPSVHPVHPAVHHHLVVLSTIHLVLLVHVHVHAPPSVPVPVAPVHHVPLHLFVTPDPIDFSLQTVQGALKRPSFSSVHLLEHLFYAVGPVHFGKQHSEDSHPQTVQGKDLDRDFVSDVDGEVVVKDIGAILSVAEGEGEFSEAEDESGQEVLNHFCK